MKRVVEMIFPAVGIFTAVLVTAGAFFIGPQFGMIIGGVLSIAGLLIFSHSSNRFWQKTVSSQLKKIEQSQKELSANVGRLANDIEFFKDQTTEKEFQRATAPIAAASPLPAPAPKSAPTAVPAQRKPHTIKAVEEEIDSLRAERPTKRGYEALIAGSHELSDNAVREVINDAVQSQRVEVFLQPVVRLPQRKVRYYEMFARVRARPGMYLPAERYLKIAREEKMIQGIDRLLITEVLDLIRETALMERAAPFFINITPESLKSAPYMNKLLAFLGNVRALAPRLIFEMQQEEFNNISKPVMDIMLALGKLGCSFSIDNVEEMQFDVERMLRLNVRYVKIPASLLIQKGYTENGLAIAQRIKKKLETNGISVIAEKVETEKMIIELTDYEINYGQGNLFGKPDMQSAYAQKAGRGRKFA